MEEKVPQPEEPSTTQPNTAAVPEQPKKRWWQRKRVVALIVAIIIAVTGGAAFAFAAVYQHPEKLVADALSNAAKATSVTFKGELVGDNSAPQEEVADVSIRFEGQGAGNRAKMMVDIGAKTEEYDMTAKGDVIFAGEDGLFFRVTNVRAILEELLGDYATISETTKTIDALVEKTNNRWIKLDADSNEGLTRELEQQRECTNKVLKKYHENSTQRQQLVDAYKHNRLFKVERIGSEVIEGTDSQKLSLTMDKSKIDGFVTALKNTDVAKALNDCYKEDIFKDLAKEMKEDSEIQSTMTVWVSTWSHEFTKFQASSKDANTSATMTVTFKFNQPVKIDTPREAVPVKNVMNDVMTILFGDATNQPPSTIEEDLILTN